MKFLLCILLSFTVLFAATPANRVGDYVYGTVATMYGPLFDTLTGTGNPGDATADSVVLFSQYIPDGDAGYLYSLVIPQINKSGTTIVDSVNAYIAVKAYDEMGNKMYEVSTGDTITSGLAKGGNYTLNLGGTFFPGKKFDIVIRGLATHNKTAIFAKSWLIKMRTYARIK